MAGHEFIRRREFFGMDESAGLPAFEPEEGQFTMPSLEAA
jgi:hypothetical protein